MRQNRAARRSSIFEHLFAERQVYLRSGLTSRYVVLSRPLQIAVTIGAGLDRPLAGGRLLQLGQRASRGGAADP